MADLKDTFIKKIAVVQEELDEYFPNFKYSSWDVDCVGASVAECTKEDFLDLWLSPCSNRAPQGNISTSDSQSDQKPNRDPGKGPDPECEVLPCVSVSKLISNRPEICNQEPSRALNDNGSSSIKCTETLNHKSGKHIMNQLEISGWQTQVESLDEQETSKHCENYFPLFDIEPEFLSFDEIFGNEEQEITDCIVCSPVTEIRPAASPSFEAWNSSDESLDSFQFPVKKELFDSFCDVSKPEMMRAPIFPPANQKSESLEKKTLHEAACGQSIKDDCSNQPVANLQLDSNSKAGHGKAQKRSRDSSTKGFSTESATNSDLIERISRGKKKKRSRKERTKRSSSESNASCKEGDEIGHETSQKRSWKDIAIESDLNENCPSETGEKRPRNECTSDSRK